MHEHLYICLMLFEILFGGGKQLLGDANFKKEDDTALAYSCYTE